MGWRGGAIPPLQKWGKEISPVPRWRSCSRVIFYDDKIRFNDIESLSSMLTKQVHLHWYICKEKICLKISSKVKSIHSNKLWFRKNQLNKLLAQCNCPIKSAQYKSSFYYKSENSFLPKVPTAKTEGTKQISMGTGRERVSALASRFSLFGSRFSAFWTKCMGKGIP